MGGSQSTRKISVENENTIQVSEEALNRVKSHVTQPEPPKPQHQSQPAPPPYYDTNRPDYAKEEAYWARRIEALKRTHEKISSGYQVEYQKTLKEAQDLYEIVNDDIIFGKLPPCQEEKTKIIKCYTDNADKSLLCSVLVNEFNICVCNSRVAAVSGTS